jgi:hypothetical protein
MEIVHKCSCERSLHVYISWQPCHIYSNIRSGAGVRHSPQNVLLSCDGCARRTKHCYFPFWSIVKLLRNKTSRTLPRPFCGAPVGESTHMNKWRRDRCVVFLLRAPRVLGTVAARNNVVSIVRFEVFTAVTMKNGVFWDVTPCGSCKNRRFEGT